MLSRNTGHENISGYVSTDMPPVVSARPTPEAPLAPRPPSPEPTLVRACAHACRRSLHGAAHGPSAWLSHVPQRIFKHVSKVMSIRAFGCGGLVPSSSSAWPSACSERESRRICAAISGDSSSDTAACARVRTCVHAHAGVHARTCTHACPLQRTRADLRPWRAKRVATPRRHECVQACV